MREGEEGAREGRAVSQPAEDAAARLKCLAAWLPDCTTHCTSDSLFPQADASSGAGDPSEGVEEPDQESPGQSQERSR